MTDNEQAVYERLKSDILSALSRVYAEDGELLSDNIDVCERSLMHRFTHYFIELVESGKDSFYKGLHVDGEYNRHGYNPKILHGKLIFPDVVLHQRGTDGRNICVIEFKKRLTESGKHRSQRANGRDVEKLRGMTIHLEDGGEFGYQWGVYIIFNAKSSSNKFAVVEMKWFHNGEGTTEDYQKYSLPLTHDEGCAVACGL